MKNLCISIFLILLVGCGKGSEGSQGLRGAQGEQGLPGLNGSSCTVTSLPIGSDVAVNGGTLITCPNGSSSVVLNGTNGVNGQAGTPGSVITPVQFCSNVTSVYPSNFPESGICVDNKLYGVYSANGGFLALLPLGTYSSNGINASCNFTITENCGVN